MEVTNPARPIEQAWEEFKTGVPVDDNNGLHKLSFYAGAMALLKAIVAGDHIDLAAINEDIVTFFENEIIKEKRQEARDGTSGPAV